MLGGHAGCTGSRGVFCSYFYTLISRWQPCEVNLCCCLDTGASKSAAAGRGGARLRSGPDVGVRSHARQHREHRWLQNPPLRAHPRRGSAPPSLYRAPAFCTQPVLPKPLQGCCIRWVSATDIGLLSCLQHMANSRLQHFLPSCVSSNFHSRCPVPSPGHDYLFSFLPPSEIFSMSGSVFIIRLRCAGRWRRSSMCMRSWAACQVASTWR